MAVSNGVLKIFLSLTGSSETFSKTARVDWTTILNYNFHKSQSDPSAHQIERDDLTRQVNESPRSSSTSTVACDDQYDAETWESVQCSTERRNVGKLECGNESGSHTVGSGISEDKSPSMDPSGSVFGVSNLNSRTSGSFTKRRPEVHTYLYMYFLN